MLQIELRNDDWFAGIAPSAFATIRVVTLAWPKSHHTILCAFVKLPVGGMIVDNFGAGGLIASVDIETGQLGRTFFEAVERGTVSNHPDTGARIEGLELRGWREALALARLAHTTLPTLRVVGWDIGITDHGAVIVEANPYWCARAVQRVLAKGLGETQFVDWYWSWRRSGAEAAGTLQASPQFSPPESRSTPRVTR